METQTLTAHREALEFAASKIALAIEDRDEAIVEALLARVPVNVVAEAVGLTRQRVWQIGRSHAPVSLA